MDSDTKWILALSGALTTVVVAAEVLDYRDRRQAVRQAREAEVYSRAGRPRHGSSDQWIQRQGKLGGAGYTSQSARARKALLRASVTQHGYRSTLSSILALERARTISSDVRGTLAIDRRWLVQTYGGEGSFRLQASKRKAA